MLFVHELHSVGIFFRICSFLSNAPSRPSLLSLNSVFSLFPLLGLLHWCSRSMCTASLVYKYPPGVLFWFIEHFVAWSEISVAMNMIVCEVEQPPGVFCSSCTSCRRMSWDCPVQINTISGITSDLGRQMPAGFSWSMLSRRAADLRLGCATFFLWRKQCSRVRFVLPSSNLEHVVVPEPSCIRVPFCYLACHSTEFIGSCKMCNLVYLLKSFVIERILSSELLFFFFC